MMFKPYLATFSLAALLAGCAQVASAPRESRLGDPSNPAAAEAPFGPEKGEAGATAADVRAGMPQLSDTVPTAALGTLLYTCSMHPQILTTQPGVCPICGMTLVKKDASAPTKEARQ